MIVLVGASSSGKSTIKNILCKDYGFRDLVTYTTRPKREYEQNDIDYHFVTDSEFEELKEEGYFAETGNYNGWSYGSAKTSYSDQTCVVLTPSGMRQLLKNKPEQLTLPIVTYYIDVPRRERLLRSLKRGDNIDEALRRNLSDVGQFDGVQNEVDYVINGDLFKPEDIAHCIAGTFVGEVS